MFRYKYDVRSLVRAGISFVLHFIVLKNDKTLCYFTLEKIVIITQIPPFCDIITQTKFQSILTIRRGFSKVWFFVPTPYPGILYPLKAGRIGLNGKKIESWIEVLNSIFKENLKNEESVDYATLKRWHKRADWACLETKTMFEHANTRCFITISHWNFWMQKRWSNKMIV